MVHARVDVMSIILLIVIIVAATAVLGFVGPKISEVQVALADIQYAPQRAELKFMNEKAMAEARVQSAMALGQAQADAIRLQAEAEKAAALAKAYADQKAIDVALVQAQGVVEKQRLDAQIQTARIMADAQSSQIAIIGIVVLLGVLAISGLSAFGIYNWQIYQQEQNRTAMKRQAIAGLLANGGSMVLDNGHSFKIEPKPQQAQPQAQPALPAPASTLSSGQPSQLRSTEVPSVTI